MFKTNFCLLFYFTKSTPFGFVKYYEMTELAELKVYKNYYLSNIHFIHKRF